MSWWRGGRRNTICLVIPFLISRVVNRASGSLEGFLVYLVFLLVPYIHTNPCNHAHACEQKHDSVMSVIGETRQLRRGCWPLDVVTCSLLSLVVTSLDRCKEDRRIRLVSLTALGYRCLHVCATR